jgi:hypothetical protein
MSDTLRLKTGRLPSFVWFKYFNFCIFLVRGYQILWDQATTYYRFVAIRPKSY